MTVERKNKDIKKKVNKYNVDTCKSELSRLEKDGQAGSAHYQNVLSRLSVLQD